MSAKGAEISPSGLRGAVREVMGPVVVVPETTPAREAAAAMTREGVTAVVVDGTPLGIVTDLDLRSRLVAAGLPVDTPVGELATRPVQTASPEDEVGDALERMVAGGFQHLPVLERGRAVGLLTGTRLLAAVGKGPFRVRRLLRGAGSVEELVELRRQVPQAAATLLASGMKALSVARVLAAFTDDLTGRLLELAAEQQGEAPAGYAWMALGSHGRREQALVPDQDHALVVEADHPWFEELARFVAEGLEAAGYPPCPHGTMATSPVWRHTPQGWRQRFTELLDEASPENVLETSILLDARPAAGDPQLAGVFDRFRVEASSNAPYMTRLAGAAVGFAPPLGWWGRIKVERGGRHAGTLDIKRAVVGPVITLARLYGLAAGSAAPDTVGRLAEAAAAGELSQEAAEILSEGYELGMRLRLEHQLTRWRQGEPLDNRIDFTRVGAWERRLLVAVFRTIEDVQDALAVRYPIAHVR